MPSITERLGNEADSLLQHTAKVSSDLLHLPGPDFVERVWMQTDRSPQVLKNIQSIYDHGRLGADTTDTQTESTLDAEAEAKAEAAKARHNANAQITNNTKTKTKTKIKKSRKKRKATAEDEAEAEVRLSRTI